MSRTLTLICENCGKLFESNRKKRFCCKKCEQNAWHKRNYIPVEKQNYTKSCAHCGKEFVTQNNNSVYCSRKCRDHESYIRNVRKDKFCVVCGKEIKYGESNDMYCSDDCRTKAYTRTCQQCGKKFISKNDHKYCSFTCAIEAQKDKTIYICKQCGKPFHRRKRESDACQFCSRECSTQYRIDHRPMVQKEFYFGIVTKCKQCGNTFFAWNNSTHYCSEECKKKWNEEHAAPIYIYFHECLQCGKKFASPQKNRKFCSEECQKKAYYKRREIRRRMWKQNNSKNADFTISLKQLYKRDQGICYLCGKKVDMSLSSNHDFYGSIDHVIPLSKGGTHTWDNVKLAHRICNSLKTDTLQDCTY